MFMEQAIGKRVHVPWSLRKAISEADAVRKLRWLVSEGVRMQRHSASSQFRIVLERMGTPPRLLIFGAETMRNHYQNKNPIYT